MPRIVVLALFMLSYPILSYLTLLRIGARRLLACLQVALERARITRHLAIETAGDSEDASGALAAAAAECRAMLTTAINWAAQASALANLFMVYGYRLLRRVQRTMRLCCLA